MASNDNGKRGRQRRKPVKRASNVYKCKLCVKTFSTITILEEHNLIHTTCKPFGCLYCNYRSALKDIMRNHIHIQHGIKMKRGDIVTHDIVSVMVQKCAICNIEFPDNDSLHLHHLSNKSCKPFRCLHCDNLQLKLAQIDSTNDINNLRVIIKPHIVNNTNPLNINIQTNNVNVNRSDNVIENPSILNVPVKVEELTESIMSDMDVETQLNTYKIEAEDTEIRDTVNALELTENENQDKQDEEEVCNMENSEEGKRKSDQIYKCTMCQQSFYSKASLHGHSFNQCGVKPFSCRHCDYRTVLKGILRHHLQVKHNISIKSNDIHPDRKDKMYTRAFLCKACYRIFTSKERLRDHRLSNDACKPFKCLYCEYRCVMKTTMKRHIKGRHGKDVNCSDIVPIKSNRNKPNDKDICKDSTNLKNNEMDIKIEVGVTEIIPGTAIKQENIYEGDLSNGFETKYDINSDAVLSENIIINNFGDNMNYFFESEAMLLNIKEEIVTDDVETPLMCGDLV